MKGINMRRGILFISLISVAGLAFSGDDTNERRKQEVRGFGNRLWTCVVTIGDPAPTSPILTVNNARPSACVNDT